MADPTLRVLLVDDNKDDFELTRRLLAGARFDRFALEWIADYDLALAAIRTRQHDAYLIDQKRVSPVPMAGSQTPPHGAKNEPGVSCWRKWCV